MHHTKYKGDVAASQAMADLILKGYRCFLPAITEHLPFVFVVFKDNKFYRIQAKYSSNGNIAASTSWTDKNGSHKKFYNENDFDYYAIYIPQINKILYPSISFSGSYIRHKLPNSPTPFYWWEDFLEFTDKANKKTFRDFNSTITNKGVKNLHRLNREKKEKAEINKPIKENLQKMLWEKPIIKISKELNISTTMIFKWIKEFDLSKPSRGYWNKKNK